MKKNKLLINRLILATTLVATSINASIVTISEDDVVKVNMTSNILKINANITIDSKNIPNAVEYADKVNGIVKNSSGCDISSYRITPIYRYNRPMKKKVFDKYSTVMTMSCNINAEEIEKFTSMINKISKVSIINISRIQSDYNEVSDNAQIIIEEKAHKKAEKKSKYYANVLKKRCYVDSLYFKETVKPKPLYRTLSKDINVLPVPKKNKIISSGIRYKIKCF